MCYNGIKIERETAMCNSKERDILFDNIKLLLIFFVVFGHAIESYTYGNSTLNIIYEFIYMFHMPLFIFISGYFSKKPVKINKSIKNLIIPFIIFNLIWNFFVSELNNEPFNMQNIKWFIPGWALWYLLSLFTWRILINKFGKYKYTLLVSVILGLVIGMIPITIKEFSIGRSITMFPFFITGYLFNKDDINKIRDVKKIIPITIILLTILICVLDKYLNLIPTSFLYHIEPYSKYSYGALEGIMLRIVVYTINMLMLFSIVSLIPNKKYRFSIYGENTMPVYVFHTYIIYIMQREILTFKPIVLLMPFMILYIGNRKSTRELYNWIVNPISKIRVNVENKWNIKSHN